MRLDPAGRAFALAHLQARQFRATERSREADQQQRPVPVTEEVVRQRPHGPPQRCGQQRRLLLGRLRPALTRSAPVVQNAASKLTGISSGNILGGTGKLAGIQGIVRGSVTSTPSIVRGSVNFDTKSGYNESQVKIEYSIGK